METNVHKALDSIPIECMRRFSKFQPGLTVQLDGYQKGLNGKQATWANKRYRGHRTLPDSILKELDEKQIA